jgi:hypothetical protein
MSMDAIRSILVTGVKDTEQEVLVSSFDMVPFYNQTQLKSSLQHTAIL